MLERIRNYFLLFFYVLLLFFVISFLDFLVDDTHLLNRIAEYDYINEKIINKKEYKDEFLTIKDVVAVKKTVFIYQQKESKGAWVEKTTEDNNGYNSQYFVVDNIETKNHVLDKKFFEKRINFIDYKLKDGTVFYGKEVENHDYFKEENSYTDLDTYISDKDQKIVESKKDRFTVVLGKLYKGKHYTEPEIGDILITYKVFKPNYLYFFGYTGDINLKAFQDYYLVKFDYDYDTTTALGIKFLGIVVIIVVANIMLFLVRLILMKLTKSRGFTLRFVPFFNEYLVYSKNLYFNSTCFTVLLLFFVCEFYIFMLIPMILLFVARQKDYYSI